jgi:2-oxoglutarate/2-oxoacid ferredoxin oxidoreductase subunit alpha
MNTGQLLKVIRAEYLLNAVGQNKVAGEPFKVTEITEKILEMVE